MEVLFERCLCGTVIPRSELQMQHSGGPNNGGVGYTSMLCKNCLDQYKDACRIVCVACLRLQGFVEPTRCPDGFFYEKGKHYHIRGCPQCKPNITHTKVLEHEAWLQANRIASKTNLDLVQEIEQKALQAQREYAKVRDEFNSPQP
jgi:hypothetical protein